jgi:hypothetical protein
MNRPNDDRRLSTADLADAAHREQDVRGAQRERFDRPQDAAVRPPDGHDDPGAVALFDEHEVGDLRTRWDGIQTNFVDDPRRAVEEADALVAATIQRLAESFANGRTRLEQQWSRGDQVSTEDLRVALTRYRSFFHRLLAM